MNEPELTDVVVIGAGIHGAGIAQACAAHGWKVTVVEQYSEPAKGTSSRSSKLVHGGLRYLETFQFRLVFECLKERALLLKNAPDLVKLQPFHIPVYRNSQRSPLWVRLGLSLYSVLGGLNQQSRFRKVPQSEWADLKGVSTKDLLAVYQYNDAQTDDVKLTKAVLTSAKSLGVSTLFNHTVKNISQGSESYQVTVEDKTKNSEPLIIHTRAVVNAAGPWVNEVAKCCEPEVPAVNIDLVKGSHILLDIPEFDQYYYLESPIDGRAFFVLPWNGYLMIGTTEKPYSDCLDNIQADDDEIRYLLDSVKHYFPDLAAVQERVVDSFAGVRVLPGNDSSLNTSANQKKRETQLVCNGSFPFYCGVYGGKLTSYRDTAEKVVKRIEPWLPKVQKIANTKDLPLHLPSDI